MNPTKKILFVIPPKVHVLDLTGPMQVFYEAKEYGAAYELHFISFQNDLTSSAGLRFWKTDNYKKITPSPGDYVFVPGAEMEYLRSAFFKKQKGFMKWLQSLYKKGVSVCSICTGAFILAEAGLLNGATCTTHWKRITELKKTYPSVLAINNILYTHEGNIYTSAGITSGIDLALAIVEEHYGPLFAHKISRELLVYYRRSSNHNQESIYLDYRNHINVGIHTVQDWLIENLHRKTTIDHLAVIANMSARNLTRTFKKITGITINSYMKRLRLEKVKTLSNNPGLTSEAIANQLGFTNSRQLRRIKK